MNTYAKLIVAATAVLVFAVVGYQFLPRSGGVGGEPTIGPSPSPMQLAYLQALGYAGTCPVTMLEASTLLDSLLQKSQAPDNCIEDSVP